MYLEQISLPKFQPDSGSTGHCISEATLAALNSLLRGASQLEALSVIQQITQTRCLSRLRIPSWVRFVFVHDQADYFAVRPESPNSRALSATAAANEWCFLNGTIFRYYPGVQGSVTVEFSGVASPDPKGCQRTPMGRGKIGCREN